MSRASTTREFLALRSQALAKARDFFAERGLIEVDCGAIRRAPPLDANIDVMSVAVSETEVGYLHTSPEYAMKELLTQGAGNIYFLGHVYRKGERGPRHNPEFAMAEWYRIGYSLSEMIEETCDFLRLFAGDLPRRVVSYREAFRSCAEVDPELASREELFLAAKDFGIDLPKEASFWERDVFIDVLLTHIVEPRLGQKEMTVMTDYPAEQAALACVIEKEGCFVAERFEIYINGLELANGYHELADEAELRRRFGRLNQKRETPYLLDEQFLTALMTGNFPACCGVSVGFDRAFMLQSNAQQIAEAIPFAWQE